MEGYNPTVGCTSGCVHCRTWIPLPRLPLPRRNPLIDAVGRTDNPCERPARCGPCCEPRPKFRRPKELPECNLNCYREEQRNAKEREAYEEYQKFVRNCCPGPPTPEMIIQALSPNHPIHVEMPYELPPERQMIIQEMPCRTDIIAGYFNPDDNKSPEQLLKEECDQTYLACGPNLPMYPCRGVISYPPIGCTTVADEMNKCGKFVCQGTKYCDPEFRAQQEEEMRQKECEKKMAAEQQAIEEEVRRRYFNPIATQPCCANQKISLTPFCNCGCDMTI